MKVKVDDLEYNVVEVGTVEEIIFYMLVEFNTDFCTHELIVLDFIPKDMNEDTLNEFLEEHKNDGYSECGTLEEMQEVIKKLNMEA